MMWMVMCMHNDKPVRTCTWNRTSRPPLSFATDPPRVFEQLSAAQRNDGDAGRSSWLRTRKVRDSNATIRPFESSRSPLSFRLLSFAGLDADAGHARLSRALNAVRPTTSLVVRGLHLLHELVPRILLPRCPIYSSKCGGSWTDARSPGSGLARERNASRTRARARRRSCGRVVVPARNQPTDEEPAQTSDQYTNFRFLVY